MQTQLIYTDRCHLRRQHPGSAEQRQVSSFLRNPYSMQQMLAVPDSAVKDRCEVFVASGSTGAMLPLAASAHTRLVSLNLTANCSLRAVSSQ